MIRKKPRRNISYISTIEKSFKLREKKILRLKRSLHHLRREVMVNLFQKVATTPCPRPKLSPYANSEKKKERERE